MRGKSTKNAAIPLQQRLRESATVFRNTQIAFLLYDDQVKEAVLKWLWLYEPTENVIRHLLGGINPYPANVEKMVNS